MLSNADHRVDNGNDGGNGGVYDGSNKNMLVAFLVRDVAGLQRKHNSTVVRQRVERQGRGADDADEGSRVSAHVKELLAEGVENKFHTAGSAAGNGGDHCDSDEREDIGRRSQ